MAKKKEVNYFEMMEDAMRHACDISDRLLELIRDFGQEGTREELPARLDAIHEIEHDGDRVHDEIIYELNRAFITPIDREDIMDLAEQIDTITDSIEDVLIHAYMYNVRQISRRHHGIKR